MHSGAARRGRGVGAPSRGARAGNVARRRDGARLRCHLSPLLPLLLLLLACALPRCARGDAPPPPCFQCRPTGWDNGQNDPANTLNLACCRAAVPPTPPAPPPAPPTPPPAAPPAPPRPTAPPARGALRNAAAVPALVGCLVGASLLGLAGGLFAWRTHRKRRGPSVPFFPVGFAPMERLRRISARISGSLRGAFRSSGGGGGGGSDGPRIGPDGLPMRIGAGNGPPPRGVGAGADGGKAAAAEGDCEAGGGGGDGGKGGGGGGGKGGGGGGGGKKAKAKAGAHGMSRSASAPLQTLRNE
jgi:hypothetical protein